MGIILVVVDFHKPAACHHRGVGLIVFLLGDIHPIFAHTHFLGEDIKANIIAVENHFDGTIFGSIVKLHEHRQAHPDRESQESQVVVGRRKEHEMLVAVAHSERLLLCRELDAVRLFVVICPLLVATSLDLQSYGSGGSAERSVTCRERVDVASGTDIGFGLSDFGRAGGVDIKHRKRSRIGSCLDCGECHKREHNSQ